MPRKPKSGKPQGARSRPVAEPRSPLLDLLMTLDEETLARVQEALRGETDDDDDDPLALFDEFLGKVETFDERDFRANEELFEEIVAVLTQLLIDENGGDREARELRATIYDRLDEAIASDRLHAAGLMLAAKILSDSGWSVPDRLKSQLVDALDAEEGATSGRGGGDLKSALAEIVEAAEGDAFVAHDALNSMLAAFPSEVAARMIATFGAASFAVMSHALAGFAMHRDRVWRRRRSPN